MRKMLLAALFGTAMAASPAAAQMTQPAMPVAPVAPIPGPEPVRPQGGHMGHMQGDRTRQQAQQMADTMFRRFDVNHDGILTRDEAQQAVAQVEAMRGGGGGDGDQGGGRIQRMVERMFAGAPSVTLQQFEAQALARFDRQDLNHDGVLTSDERQQGWGNRAAQ
ncbi:EF-hand domain-containing protein [Sphingomonas sp.]|uniref:EF-hand domain-containing protein n=1 Tax=Sphingomonas sp. TaxID=28214 RepID=UPI0025FA71C2|nr:EF-hand domain-containing protein [Sphingomonas sp.]MBV9527384.1 hypothetical protein [Sphingomonas sp.]